MKYIWRFKQIKTKQIKTKSVLLANPALKALGR